MTPENVRSNVTVTSGPVPATNSDAPPLTLPGYGLFQPRQMVIASVHFQDLRYSFHHSGRRQFILKAPKKGEISYCKIYDSQQLIRDTQDPMEPTAQFMPAPVPVEAIANDLISAWAGGGIGAANIHRPGIMVIKGEVADEDERKRLFALEEMHCRMQVEEADRIARGSEKGVINDYHRMALDWLDSEKRDWYKPIEKGRTKVSVVSGTRIPMEAIVDQGVDLIEYYIKYNLDPLAYEDTHVAKLLKQKPEIVISTKRRLGMDNGK